MMSPVAEILVGARVDPDFGPLIVVGAGGINVELYKDVAVRIAPISEEEALAALAATRISRVLDGWRGATAGRRRRPRPKASPRAVALHRRLRWRGPAKSRSTRFAVFERAGLPRARLP